jgi:LuxR family transcriptional regulator, maltose regulon positive regulatory protein
MVAPPSGRPLLGPEQTTAVPEQARPSRDSPPTQLSTGPVLLRTKVCPPPVRPGLIPRPRLDTLVSHGADARLCLINAPAGSGKTTLLARWSHAQREGRKIAWLSLEEIDDDPARFWAYIVEAFRIVDAASGQAPLALLQGSGSADVLTQLGLPQLLNELAEANTEVVLVLDDLHTITNSICTQTLAFFIDHLPPTVHVVIASRVDPPLPLARLRANGDLVELRIADLEFTPAEASVLLNDAMSLDLASPDVRRLWEGTEGWAAGLYLAGLSLQGREERAPLIASVEEGHRHIVDYLGAEVLARQPERLRDFMLQTSILDRLSAPLCDAVLQTHDSSAVLTELEHSIQFLIPLDDHRQWYRYHHLFAQLLRLELADHDAAVIPVLHQRAAQWHRGVGDVDAAVHHAIAAGEFSAAETLIAQYWVVYLRKGQIATVERWLREFPKQIVLSEPSLALIAAWVGGQRGHPAEMVEQFLRAAESGDQAGQVPAGMSSIAFGAALSRATHPFGDVGRSLQAAYRTLEVAGPPSTESHRMGAAVLGVNLYLSGRLTEARRVLTELSDDAPKADEQPFVVLNLFAILSLLADLEDDYSAAENRARLAMEVAETQGLRYDPLSGFAYIALARSAGRRGALVEAEQLLSEALPVLENPTFTTQCAHALLDLAKVRHARGDGPGARDAIERARNLIARAADPGMLISLLDETAHELGRTIRKRPSSEVPLTERELIVLRMLATPLTQQEIARELYVSVNTVRSQIQGIYRKTGTASRQDAVARARELGLLAGAHVPRQ